MTKKDYRLIAGAIKQALNDTQSFEASEAIKHAATILADHLCTNPRFDIHKFLQACDCL